MKKSNNIKEHLVTKSNDLINKRYDLSLEEQRLIMILVSQVQPEDKEFTTFNLQANEFAKLLGIKQGGSMYEHLKKTTKNLMKKVIEIDTGYSDLQLHWLSKCEYIRETGIVILQIHDDLRPYLLELKKHFASYKLRYALPIKNKYGIRIYELCKSNEYKNSFIMTLDEIRHTLCCDTYKQWIHIKQRIIEPSVKEINLKTDLFIDYKMIKEGRRVVTVEFIIKKSNIIEEEIYKTNSSYGIDVMKELALAETM